MAAGGIFGPGTFHHVSYKDCYDRGSIAPTFLFISAHYESGRHAPDFGVSFRTTILTSAYSCPSFLSRLMGIEHIMGDRTSLLGHFNTYTYIYNIFSGGWMLHNNCPIVSLCSSSFYIPGDKIGSRQMHIRIQDQCSGEGF